MSSITDNMHDLAKWFTERESYHDFEGMADAKAVLNLCKDPTSGKYIWDSTHPFPEDKPQRELLRSLLLSYLYERADTFGIDDLNYDKIVDPFEAIQAIIGCRWFSKVTDEQIREIEESTDETDSEDEDET